MKKLALGLLALITASFVPLPAQAEEKKDAPPKAIAAWNDEYLVGTTWLVTTNGVSIECTIKPKGAVTSRKTNAKSGMEVDIRKWELRDGGSKIAWLRRGGDRDHDQWVVMTFKDRNTGMFMGATVGMTRLK